MVKTFNVDEILSSDKNEKGNPNSSGQTATGSNGLPAPNIHAGSFFNLNPTGMPLFGNPNSSGQTATGSNGLPAPNIHAGSLFSLNPAAKKAPLSKRKNGKYIRFECPKCGKDLQSDLSRHLLYHCKKN
ncbi:hypothetical protein CAEBREN_04536 [Caenorhabditis brenneri]|uniref:Uncharacterized protein n=1 Tax=Caenorhabditis brenneri TaxID=135651 RepID=G0M9L2_CAEBE|nr:hypothetical protein CAEBREN_04536 [Caenorhabditis brenneri]